MSQVDFSLYLITDRKGCGGRDLPAVVEEALQGGVKAVQLREKDLPPRQLHAIAVDMRRLTSRYGARLFINDRIDIALAVEADGVHLGEQSVHVDVARRLIGTGKLIGVSCHGTDGALAAAAAGADFITFGPVHFTPSKAAYGEPLGLSTLADASRLIDIPVFAIGGIDKENVKEAIFAGARGVALISAVLAADSPREATESLIAALERMERKDVRRSHP